MKQVAIVGLGLIGGSIAKALRQRTNLRLLAVDRCEVGLRSDVRAVVSEFIASDEVTKNRSSITESDLIVLCQPVTVIASTVATYLSAHTAVTDTGSTKRLVAARAEAEPGRAWFVPGHPMAGKAQGGFENATGDLFEGRPWIVCPQGKNDQAIACVDQLIELVGAKRVVMTPEEHDAAVAITSHVPQLLSSWLWLTGNEQNALAAAGPVFSEMTRTAGGAESMWHDIFETNADEVGQLARDVAFTFSAISEALLVRPPRMDVVLDLLRKARTTRR